MEQQHISVSGIKASRIITGTMDFGVSWDAAYELTPEDYVKARDAVEAALECSINMFDLADVYMKGNSDRAFAYAMRELGVKREDVILQTKCGIKPPEYDFSYEHIMASVDGSLQRLETDYVDILLLHRPDPLVEPEEVARAFDELQAAGKVRHFGVSNHSPAMIDLLKTAVKQPLVVSQMEFSLLNTSLIDAGLPTPPELSVIPVGFQGTIEYARTNNVCLQAWGPLNRGFLAGKPAPEGHRKEERINKVQAVIKRMAEERDMPWEAVALAWILRHPAGMQVVTGTTRADRIRNACRATEVELSRSEWYELFRAGRNHGV